MAFFQQARRPSMDMPRQQVFNPQPRPGLLMPQFGGNMAGGGIAGFLQPLAQYLRQEVGREQVDPFIQEVAQMAQQKFNLQGSGSGSIGPEMGPFQELLGIGSLLRGINEFTDFIGPTTQEGNPVGQTENVLF